MLRLEFTLVCLGAEVNLRYVVLLSECLRSFFLSRSYRSHDHTRMAFSWINQGIWGSTGSSQDTKANGSVVLWQVWRVVDLQRDEQEGANLKVTGPTVLFLFKNPIIEDMVYRAERGIDKRLNPQTRKRGGRGEVWRQPTIYFRSQGPT